MASRCSALADARPILNGCSPAGTKRTASSDSASAASMSGSRCPRCGGSKLPPKIPRRTPQDADGVGGGVDVAGGPVVDGGAFVVAGIATGTGVAMPSHVTRTSASSG